jgi:hypothetical protein
VGGQPAQGIGRVRQVVVRRAVDEGRGVQQVEDQRLVVLR